MRLRHKIKSRIAAAMAAVMVFSMAAPALPVYAAARTITFDTGDGPQVTDGPNHYTTNSITVNESQFLRDAAGFSGVTTVDSADNPVAASDPTARPAMPWKTGVDAAHGGPPAWPGYIFDRWYDGSDPLHYPITTLPIAMPTGSNITYVALWKPDTSATAPP